MSTFYSLMAFWMVVWKTLSIVYWCSNSLLLYIFCWYFVWVNTAHNLKHHICFVLFFSVLYCPDIYDNTLLSVTCPGGLQNGGKCSFSCKNGSELIGRKVTTCRRSKHETFAFWDFKNEHPYCKGNRVGNYRSLRDV